ncbi:MAG: Fe/S-dependent 2-methylisocitrate dehydratase AcnD, partial [Neisseriaceae bacterium]|nr:Fe/S-dependent 2-methylisocitrate dehydratase AcnD [Neisseriaceae bacterium]
MQTYRKLLPNSDLEYFDAKSAINAIQPNAYEKMPYCLRVFAENLLRNAHKADNLQMVQTGLKQLALQENTEDFAWYPYRVVCHDILGQTALVDLAGLRDAIHNAGGNPHEVNPVVKTQLIVDHSLAVEFGGFDKDAFSKNRAVEERRNADRFHFINWTKTAFENIDVVSAGNGIMHQINLEKLSPVIAVENGVAFPDCCVGTDSHTPHTDALGVISVGVGGLEAESVMLGRASMMRLPEIVGVEIVGKRAAGITATDIVLH